MLNNSKKMKPLVLASFFIIFTFLSLYVNRFQSFHKMFMGSDTNVARDLLF